MSWHDHGRMIYLNAKKMLLFTQPFKYQPHKMVKHVQTISRQQSMNCLSVFDYFVGLTLKELLRKGLFRILSNIYDETNIWQKYWAYSFSSLGWSNASYASRLVHCNLQDFPEVLDLSLLNHVADGIIKFFLAERGGKECSRAKIMSAKRVVQFWWQILTEGEGVILLVEVDDTVNVSSLCPFQSWYMVYAHLFLFKLKISLWELQGFGTRQIGEINCFMYWLCSPFSLIILFIPLVKNISALAENNISNCVSTDVKYSSQNSMDIPETGNRISLSLVCFCQID